MTYFITGGCGFIGRNLVLHLLQNHESEIVVYDNFSSATAEDLKSAMVGDKKIMDAFDAGKVRVIEGDIRDREGVQKYSHGSSVVIHLAANTGVAPSVKAPHFDCETNVLGTLNVLEACRENQIKRFVFASSGAPVGDNPPPIHEEMAPKPASPYGASKLAGEGYCSAYCRCFGIETVALRFGNVYGPRSAHKESVVAKFINLALAKKEWEIYGDGGQTRDFIYINDLIAAVDKAAHTLGIGGEIFQIATSKETTVLELAEELAEVIQEAGHDRPAIKFGDRRTGDVMRNFSKTDKARDRLGWQAKTQLREGLRETVSWFAAPRS